MAYVDEETVRALKLHEVGSVAATRTGSQASSGASSPKPRAEGRSFDTGKEQRQQPNILIGPDYDYWADVADSW
jgi:hypothetical protein